jgi:hypothetical protein
MNHELINPTNILWKASQCGYCQKKFTSPDLTNKNYRLLVYASVQIEGIMIIAFHKQCWIEYNQSLKTAHQQMTNDPIYRWSGGEWITPSLPLKNEKPSTAAEYLRRRGYLVQENIYQNNQSQVSNSSLLKEMVKKIQEHKARQKILMTQFQTISDVELIVELRRRVSKQDIKLSIYPHQKHIFMVAKDMNKEANFSLPIEKKLSNY